MEAGRRVRPPLPRRAMMRQDVMRGVPRDINAMREYFAKMYELRTHVKGVKINPGTNNLEIDLSMTTHNVGAPDVYLPIKRGKTNDAKALVEGMLRSFSYGYAASESDVQTLYDLVDTMHG
jgi:hypothetical protein